MQGYLLFLLFIIIGAFILSVLTERELVFTIPLVFNLTVVIFYLFGYAGQLEWAVWAVLGIEVIGIFYAFVYRKIGKKEFSALIKPGVFFFLASAAIIWGLNNKQCVNASDDLYHWGLVIKNMFYYNKFAISDYMNITYTTYPQGSALPAYFALKLQGSWNEGLLFSIQAIWHTALCLQVLKKAIWNAWMQNAAVVFMVLCMPLIWSFRYTVYNTLGVDTLLASLLAYLLVTCVIQEKGFVKDFALWTGMAVIVLIKETGLFLACFVIVFYLVRRLLEKTGKKSRVLLGSVMCIIFCFIVSSSWKWLLAFEDSFISRTIASKFSMSTLLDIINGSADPIYYQTMKNAAARIFNPGLIKLGWNQTYILWFVVFVLILLISLWISGGKEKLRRQAAIYVALMTGGAFLWWFGVMYVTLFQFTAQEMQVLSSYDRYLCQYFLGILIALSIILIYNARVSRGTAVSIIGHDIVLDSVKLSTICIFLLLLMIGLLAGRPIISNLKYLSGSASALLEYRREGNSLYQADILNELIPGKDHVYLIAQDGKPMTGEYYKAVFELAPISTNRQHSYNSPDDRRLSFDLGNGASAEDSNATFYTVEEFRDVLKDYTYLCILECDDKFLRNYKELFQEEAAPGWFYKVESEGTDIRLVKYKKY